MTPFPLPFPTPFCSSAPKHMVLWSKKFHIHNTHTSSTHFFQRLLLRGTSLWLKLPQVIPHQKRKHLLGIFFFFNYYFNAMEGRDTFQFCFNPLCSTRTELCGEGKMQNIRVSARETNHSGLCFQIGNPVLSLNWASDNKTADQSKKRAPGRDSLTAKTPC